MKHLDLRTHSLIGSAGPTPPASLAVSGGLHVHGIMSYTGTPSDVLSVTFTNGMTMHKVVAGNGLPVTLDANGLHFWNGCYLAYTPSTAISFDAAGAFARITVADLIDPDSGADISTQWQYPISMSGSGEAFLGFAVRGTNAARIASDVGFHRVYLGTGVDDILTNTPFVIGAHFDMHHRDEKEAAHTIWRDGQIIGGKLVTEPIMPTEWAIGKSFHGTIHEGITFVRAYDAGGDLYPPGVTSKWICDQLAPAQP